MTGLCKKIAGSRVESFSKPQKVQKTESHRRSSINIEEKADKKFKCLFNDFLEVFLKQVSGESNFRPLPPLIFDGQEVDLLKLYIVVKEGGGYESLSRNGLWVSVAEDCGFKLSIGVALKLVYNRYLYKLDRWLRDSILVKKDEKVGLKERDISLCGLSMDLNSDLKGFMLEIMDKKKKEGDFMNIDIKKDESGFEGSGSNFKNPGFLESNGSYKNEGVVVNEKTEQRCGTQNSDENKSGIIVRKRKRECHTALNWISKVAKDPCNPEICSLPERQKWKYYGKDQEWKQILLVREAMLKERITDPSCQQSIWQQKKQKMHPSMYDDESGSERLRCSQRLISAKDSSSVAWERIGSESSSGSQNDEDSTDKKLNPAANSVGFWFNIHRPKRIPIGPLFQAEIPEFSGEAYNSDSKWLGAQIWPLKKVEVLKDLIERERIGKGRQESCGCPFPGSVECVRFHITAKRRRVKLELGSAFYLWQFDRLGEDVARSWTEEEGNKFQDIVKSNASSPDKYFWDEIFKFFPLKGRESLVSYYYNVFLLQLRGYQNRNTTYDIDSDGEESEFGPLRNRFGQLAANSPGSIFCSPKKPQR